MIRRHRWNNKRCRHCGCTKNAVCWVGRGLILWTYVRSDGIRFTGQAPPCTPAAGATAYTEPPRAMSAAA